MPAKACPPHAYICKTNGTNLSVGGKTMLRARGVETMYKAAMFFMLAIIVAKGAEGQEPNPDGQTLGADRSSSIDSPTPTSQATGMIEGSHWFGRVGLAGMIYHSGATLSSNGAVIPGATVDVSHDVTLTLDVGYDVTKNIFTSLMVGIPPKPTITGQGSVAALGELGAVRYGPAILWVGYRFRRWGAFQPYAGPGVVYAIILKDHDASVSDLHVRNNFGFVLQAGAEYRLPRKWSLFVDVKQMWLGVDAHGFIGTAPVGAHVKLNPTLFSTGLKYHF